MILLTIWPKHITFLEDCRNILKVCEVIKRPWLVSFTKGLKTIMKARLQFNVTLDSII